MDTRDRARDLARKHLSEGDALGWFEHLYASASGDAQAIPWAELRPNPNLVSWLDDHPVSQNLSVLTVGCGLGDDAEELARRGLQVTAFDISPTAVDWCRRRFPTSGVRYAVADLLAPPPVWAGAFDLVVESYTLQVLPAGLLPQAMSSLASFLRSDGELLVICRGRSPEDPAGEMPWPLTRPGLARVADAAGLREHGFDDYLDAESPPVRRFRAVYRRA